MLPDPFGFSTAAIALRTSLALVSVACLIAATEDIVHRKAFSTHRLLSWEIERTEYRDGTLLLRTLDFVFRWPNINFFFVLRLCASVAALCAAFLIEPLPWLGVWPIFLATLIMGLKARHGLDGSHHMTLVVLLPCSIASSFPGDPAVQKVCAIYVAAQLSLSYFLSGVVKSIGASWRSGEAFAGIFSAETYGSEALVRLAKSIPAFGPVFCWLVIIYEIVFPLVFVLPLPVQIAFVILGLIFHLAIAVFMGLNKFVWSWWSAYPCLLWCLWGHG